MTTSSQLRGPGRRRANGALIAIVFLAVCAFFINRGKAGRIDVGRESGIRIRDASDQQRSPGIEVGETSSHLNSAFEVDSAKLRSAIPRVRLIDSTCGDPVPGLTVEFQSPQLGASILTRQTDSLGIVSIDCSGDVSMGLRDTSYLIRDSDRLSLGPNHDAGSALDVQLVPACKIIGHIKLEAPELVPDASGVALALGPLIEERLVPSANAGQIEMQAWSPDSRRTAAVTASTSGDFEFCHLIPATGRAAVSVGALGHLTEVKEIDGLSMRGKQAECWFELRRGEAAWVQVVDEGGMPIKDACVQYVSYRVIPLADLDPKVEVARRDATKTALTITTSGKENIARITHTAQQWSDERGIARLAQLAAAQDLYLVVWAPGRDSFLAKQQRPDEFRDATVCLRERVAEKSHVTFQYEGRDVKKGTLLLSVPVDGFLATLPTIDSLPDGRFSTEWITPGQEYYCCLGTDLSEKPFTGWYVFGKPDVVDVSSFRRQRESK